MTLIINQTFSNTPLIIYHIRCYIVNIDIWLHFMFWHGVIMLIALCKKMHIYFTSLCLCDSIIYKIFVGSRWIFLHSRKYLEFEWYWRFFVSSNISYQMLYSKCKKIKPSLCNCSNIKYLQKRLARLMH